MLCGDDILSWDVVNWSACLRIWEPHVSAGPFACLEIGCGSGGLSLWLASKGHNVVCSDKAEPGPAVRELHRLHGAVGRIEYKAIDATAVPYTEHFDIVVFKSVLGGIWGYCGIDSAQQSMREIHKALKPRGKCLFAENLRATRFHMFCRTRFRQTAWKYPTIEEMIGLLPQFSRVQYELAGFLGAFGRTNTQRKLLGCIDKCLAPWVPRDWRYIMIGVAEK